MEKDVVVVVFIGVGDVVNIVGNVVDVAITFTLLKSSHKFTQGGQQLCGKKMLLLVLLLVVVMMLTWLLMLL